MALLPLPCPICAQTAQFDPAHRAEAACTGCGCGLIPHTQRGEDEDELATWLSARCPACRREIRPGAELVFGLRVECPHCGAPLLVAA